MNLKKTFSSRQFILIISFIAIASLIGFLIVQNQIKDLESEIIKSELELKKNTERLLFDLKATLESGLDEETKTSEALSILSNIRSNLDKEYVYLRIEAQQKVNILYGRLDEIEKAILEDPNSAISLVNNLIKDLQDSEDLASFGEDDNNDNNGSGSDYNFVPDYLDTGGNNNNNTGDDSQTPVDNTNTNTDTTTDNTTNPDDIVENPDDQKTYHSGYIPEVDRDKTPAEGAEPPVELKIGD